MVFTKRIFIVTLIFLSMSLISISQADDRAMDRAALGGILVQFIENDGKLLKELIDLESGNTEMPKWRYA